MNLEEIKAKYPAYANIPDQELADRIYQKHYATKIPIQEYYQKIGFQPNQATTFSQDVMQGLKGAIPKALEVAKGTGEGIYDLIGGNLPKSETPFEDALKQIIGMRTNNEKQHGYNASDLAKDLGAGFTKGLRSLGNAPGNAINYLGEKLYGDLPHINIPDVTLPDSINNLDINKAFGIEETTPGNELVQGLSGFAPALLASAGNPYVAQALASSGENQNVLSDVLGLGALHAAPKAISSGANLVKNIPKGIEAIVPEKYSQQKTATKAQKLTQDFMDYFEKGYDDILSMSELPQRVELDVNARTLNKYKKAAPKHSSKVKKAIKTGDLKDIHYGASQLGKFIDKEYKSMSPNYEAINLAEGLKRKFENILDKNLAKVPDAQRAYRELDAEYESTLGRINPKIRQELREFGKNRLGAEDVMRKLRGPETGKYFRHRFGEEFPGIESAVHENPLRNIPFVKQLGNLYDKHLGKK